MLRAAHTEIPARSDQAVSRRLSGPEVRFAKDSPLEGAVRSEPVSENRPIPGDSRP